MEDRISQLPDDILSYIFTTLSMEDLSKAILVSRRWCKLSALRIDLYFHIFNVLGSSEKELLPARYLMNFPITKLGFLPTIKRVINLDGSANEFVKRVDQFVKNFQGTIVDSFMVNFHLDYEQSNTIDQWILFAIARRVRSINLLFLGRTNVHHTTRHNRYKFDFALFSKTNASSLNHLRLENCLVCHPFNCDFIPFKNLRSLSLEEVELDESFIENVLSNCLQLQELFLFLCEFKSSKLEIVSSSLCHLKIIGCYMVSNNKNRMEVNLILLDCLKLRSLVYRGYIWCGLDIVNINTPMVKSIDFSISFNEDLNAFAQCATFPELEIMHVDIYSTVAAPKTTQPFKHLRQLNLILSLSWEILNDVGYDLLWILNILQASPILQKLLVMFPYPRFLVKQKDIRDVETFSHNEVKIVELGGCVGNWFEIEFVMNVLKHAQKLELIVLGPYWEGNDSLGSNSDRMWFKSGRERINKKLQGELVVGRKKVVLI